MHQSKFMKTNTIAHFLQLTTYKGFVRTAGLGSSNFEWYAVGLESRYEGTMSQSSISLSRFLPLPAPNPPPLSPAASQERSASLTLCLEYWINNGKRNVKGLFLILKYVYRRTLGFVPRVARSKSRGNLKRARKFLRCFFGQTSHFVGIAMSFQVIKKCSLLKRPGNYNLWFRLSCLLSRLKKRAWKGQN